MYIESITDIQAQSELLVAYGKEYWDVIKKNIKEKIIESKKELIFDK